MNFAWRIYRRLAQAFPHEFKLAYGTEVMQLGEDVIEDIAKRDGAAGLIRLIADHRDSRAARIPERNARRYAVRVRALIKSPGFALVASFRWDSALG